MPQKLGDAPPGVLGGAFDGRFGQADAGHPPQDVDAAVEALDAAGQGGEPLDGRGEVPGRDAGLKVEGASALAAAATVVVGPRTGNHAEEADEIARAVGVVGGGVVTARTGHAGPFVAVFF